MITVKNHKRKGKNKVSVVRTHSRAVKRMRSATLSKGFRSREHALGHSSSYGPLVRVRKFPDDSPLFDTHSVTDKKYVGRTKNGVVMKIIGRASSSATQASNKTRKRK